MKKRALLVGINYVGTSYSLKGCLNDVKHIKALLEGKGFADIEVLTEKDATTANILAALKRLVADAEPGDVLVFHYSGHGSQIYSKLETDMLDEIICPIDLDWKEKVITDNELKEIFNPVPNGVNITVILDCCHSGTALDQTETAKISGTKDLSPPHTVKVVKRSKKSRYLAPPAEVLQNISDKNLELRDWSTSRDINETALLIAGCQPNQTSADATIGGVAQGAATAALISAVNANPEITYQELFESMTSFMVTNKFTQRPALDGASRLYQRKFLESWADEAKPVVEEVPVLTDEVVEPNTEVKQENKKMIGLVAAVCAVVAIILILV